MCRPVPRSAGPGHHFGDLNDPRQRSLGSPRPPGLQLLHDWDRAQGLLHDHKDWVKRMADNYLPHEWNQEDEFMIRLDPGQASREALRHLFPVDLAVAGLLAWGW